MKTNIQGIKTKIAELLLRHDVKKASIFGSFARGEATEKSDVDILVEFTGEKSLLDLVTLELELQKVLHRKVDVHTFKSVDPLIRKEVFHQQVPLI